MTELTHLDARGQARMVDVSAKPETAREAVARGRVVMAAATLERILGGSIAKGDVLATARIAGIQAAKRTADLIPLCHALPLAAVRVELTPGEGALEIEAVARTVAQTGVEMEALTAVTVAALTIYDMAKAIDRSMRIEAIRLVRKSGGASGDFAQD